MNSREPIAVVGMGCRLPGAESIDAFARLLAQNLDAIGEVPAERWDASAIFHPDRGAPGYTYARRGGFLRDVDRFDAQHFGISPREAASMDPQMRLMLEIASDTFDDAGFDRAKYGAKTGVYVGISGSDYQDILLSDREAIDGYMATGTALCIAANRISHAFDLHGPSMAVETACSSSLVATHLACSALWSGECDAALAGGVCLLLRPEVTIGFGKGFMLSRQAQCRAFDVRGDGFVRGEGAAIVLLKRLSDALRDRDSIWSLILATHVNQDGHTPTGIAVPNVEAQKAALQEVYGKAGIDPADVHFVEAHGPGTPVGDPVEASALGTVLGAGRGDDDALLLGSVKTNIGHLEPAAGIAGLVKTVLSLAHGQVFANLHFEEGNSAIDFAGLRLRVPVANEPWTAAPGKQRFAGVNSFGFGGTNAHVVLAGAEFAVEEELRRGGSRGAAASKATPVPRVLPLSARSEEGLRAHVESMATWLQRDPDVSFEDVCYTAACRRQHEPHRVAVVARSSTEAAEELRAWLGANPRPAIASVTRPGRVAFVFCGMGSHWWGMAQELLGAQPVFRRAVEACDGEMRPWVGWSLLEEMQRDEADSRLARFNLAQPAMFAVQCGLVAIWRSFGVEPAAIVGHSVGEAAAAYAAGALSLRDAARVVVERSRLQVTTQGKGKLLAVGMSEAEIAPYLRGHEAHVSVAALNGPRTMTLAGDPDALEAIARALELEDVFVKFLRADVPAHSPAMQPLCGPLARALGRVDARAATTPLYSTVTGDRVEGHELDGGYWASNLRQPVRFASAIGRMLDTGVDRFLEISPHPVLSASIAECATAARRKVTTYPSIRRKEPELRAVAETLAALHVSGVEVAWERAVEGSLASIPSYPWQRERHWKEPEGSSAKRSPRRGPPLLGLVVPSSSPTWELGVHSHAFEAMYDHCVQGDVIWPAAGYVEMALEAIGETHPDAAVVLRNVALERAMVMPREGVVVARSTVDDRSFAIASRAAQRAEWTRNASGTFDVGTAGAGRARLDVPGLRARCAGALSHEDVYAKLTRMGDDFGPAFRTVKKVWLGERECLAEVEGPADVVAGVRLDPVLLDGCFQALVANLPREAEGSALPVRIRELRVFGRLARSACAHARLTRLDAAGFEGDLTIADEDGRVLVEVRGFEFKSLERSAAAPRWSRESSPLHLSRWELEAARPVNAAIGGPAFALAPAILGARAAILAEKHGRRRHYEEARPRLDALARAYVAEALGSLGLPLVHGQRIVRATLATNLGVVASQRQAFESALFELEAAGVLERAEDAWVVAEPPPSLADEVARSVAVSLPEYVAEIGVLHRCGTALAEVWRGALDPLSLVFPDGETGELEHLYSTGPTAFVYNRLLAESLASLARTATRPLRVLEVGAGTGGTTVHLLPALGENVAEYVYTDVSRVLLQRAEDRFVSEPRLVFRELDLDKDPGEQGFEAGSFDLVVAADAVHATRSAGASVHRLRELLRPGGVLALIELTHAPFWTQVTFGLLAGWWAFEDTELRRDSALLPRKAWRRLLEREGLEVACASDREDGEQSVLLARAPAAAATCAPRELPSGTLLVAHAGDRVGVSLVAELRAQGRSVLELLDAGAPDPWRAIEARFAVARPSVVVLCASDGGEAEGAATSRAVALIQALARASFEGRLCFATAGAQRVGRSEKCVPARAALWGLGRVVANEHPEWRIKMIDVASDDDSAPLAGELACDDAEDEIALRPEGRWVRRWRRVGVEPMAPPEGRPAALPAGCVRISPLLVGQPDESLAAWEVVARVAEAAHDVALTEGTLVAGFSLEDPSTTRILPARQIVPLAGDSPMPNRIAGAAALTVLHLWLEDAKLKAGDALWVHGSGGDALVQAAVHACRAAGVTAVVSAAGGAGADPFVAMLDGRSIRLDDDLREAAGGRLFDGVLLCETPSRRMDFGRCLAPGAYVGLARGATCGAATSFGDGVTIAPFDPSEILARPAAAGAFARVVEALAVGASAAVPHRVLVGADARGAKRAARGIRIVDVDGAPARARPTVVADATYLLIGGLGGLGLRVARHLVDRGAMRLVLMGRSGARGEAAAVVDALRARDVDVHVATADATVTADLARALDVARSDPARPLRGVFHAAMVLEDATLQKLDRSTIARVMAPKADVAEALDRLTRADSLDFFVLFSSFASIVGNPGQGAYAAANAVLDALAESRRAAGLPATSINWGSVSGVGYVAVRGEIDAHLRARGITPIPDGEAMDLFDRVISGDEAQVAVIDVNWSRWCAVHAAGTTPRFERLRGARAQDAAGTRQEGESETASVLDAIRAQVARSLRMPPARLDVDVPLLRLGFDSLMAVELRTMLHAQLGADVPAMKIMRGPSVRELADYVERPATRASVGPAAPTVGETLVRLSARPLAATRLFCVPYNGGSVASFHGWDRLVPASLEVYSAQLAGQMDRRDEPAPASLVAWANDLADAILPLLDRPYALYGHSLGGLVAFEAIRALRARGCRPPAALFVGAIHAPHLPDPFPASDRLTDLATLERLGMLAALAPLLADRQLVDALRPTVQTGIERLKAYRAAPEPPLGCPIVAMGGTRDGIVGSESLDGWRAHTRGDFERLSFDGGHLFHQECSTDVAAAIAARLGAASEIRGAA